MQEDLEFLSDDPLRLFGYIFPRTISKMIREVKVKNECRSYAGAVLYCLKDYYTEIYSKK